MRIPVMACVAAVVLGTAAGGAVQAQALKRTPLQAFDVPPGRYEAIIGTSELGPNQSAGRQSHPGPEGGYVLRGGGSILVDGQPPLVLSAGQSYQLAPGAVHEVRSGPDGVELLVTWIVEKGKPLVSPAD
jgi:quercetin dioxygenase-like cupin family protein